MKISIITVCYNEEKNIASTIESVLNQTSQDYEFIICDGESKDRTVEISQSYISDFEKKLVNYKIFSEEDGGIYSGMNNGISRVNGDYVIFMNAGDRFYNEEVIKVVTELVGEDRPEVIYGDCQIIDRGACYTVRANHNDLCNNMSICHQSIFVRADVIKENKFDINYKIAADYDMMLSFYLRGYEFLKLDKVISSFSAGGISSVKIVKSVSEACDIKDKHGIVHSRKLEIKNANKNQRIIKLKRSIPKPLWKLWNKTIKKREWIDQENHFNAKKGW